MSDILAVQAVLQDHDPFGHRRILGTHRKLVEVTGATRWLLGDIGQLLKDYWWFLGGYWEVTGVTVSPGSHLCLSMDLGVEEAVLTLKDGLRGASQHLNLQATGQGPAQRDSLSCWLEGLLQALQHLGTEGRTPQFAAPPGFSPWPPVSGVPGGPWNVWGSLRQLGSLGTVRSVGYSGAEPRHLGSQWGGTMG